MTVKVDFQGGSSGGGMDWTVANSGVARTITNITDTDFVGLTSVGDCAFQYCSSLTSVNLPLAMSIGNYAFGSCYKLTTVSIPSATSIGDYAFQYCRALTSADFPLVASIGIYCFYGCYKLITLSLPSVLTLPASVFGTSRCDALTTINIGSSVTSINSLAFNKQIGLPTITITIAKPTNSIAGAPWGATGATVVWTG